MIAVLIHYTPILPEFIFQIEINYRVAFRRTGGHMCDQKTLENKTLLRGEGSLQCTKGCYGSITTMSYYCTDFSDTEDWTTGTNSVTYNITASSNNIFHFGYVLLSIDQK